MRILLINNKEQQCGVADYGRRLYEILKQHFVIQLAEIGSLDEYNTDGYDTILYNYHYATLPFITDEVLDKSKRHVAIFHEAHLEWTPDKVIDTSIRPLFENIELADIKNPTPVIGSFGFGFPDKNFSAIAERVKDQFDTAIIRLNIPFAYHGDKDGYLAKREADKVREICDGSGIQVEISHEFLSHQDLIKFLRGNDINLFLYNYSHGRGLSSAIDYALSAYRPIGVSDSEMFRHLPTELRNTDLRWLMANWFEVLKPVYEANSNAKLIEKYKQCLLGK